MKFVRPILGLQNGRSQQTCFVKRAIKKPSKKIWNRLILLNEFGCKRALEKIARFEKLKENMFALFF